MPNPMMMPGGMFGMVAGAPRKQPEDEEKKRQSYWQGGDKFTGRDALAAGLAAIGDGFSTWANGPSAGGATGMLIGGRGRAIEQAKAAQAAAQAAAQEEQQRQRLRGEKLEDLRGELKVRGEFKDPTPPRFEQDNAGNVWALDPQTGRPMGESPVFVDRTERFMNQNGAILNVPNPYASQGQQLPTAPVGRLTPLGTQGTQAPPQLQMNPQAQSYLDEAMKAEMMAGARRDGRDYMQRMGY